MHTCCAENDDEQQLHESGAGKMSRSKVSLVPKETATYLTEVMAHFKTLIDGEEKALLVGNVLEEIAGAMLCCKCVVAGSRWPLYASAFKFAQPHPKP